MPQKVRIYEPGELLYHYRSLGGFSQAALAVMVGTSPQQISRLELTRRKMTESWRERLAPGLKIHPDDLKRGSPPRSKVKQRAMQLIDKHDDRGVELIMPLLEASHEYLKPESDTPPGD